MENEKPKTEENAAARQKAMCDLIVERAASMMVKKAGADIPLVLDRMLTYAAAQACTMNGSPHTAAAFRLLADKIEGGVFHGITGEADTHARRH
ncbi:hypothetical protein [Rhizobium sp. 1399]|uniref:hypothetical protein n=1 Tax=Rhizobium sp. 1399 TaxID=2817758 RepID=UPI002863088F|nr:hypothetical protein [Rhizobium sp. 1399]MDR6664283.1 hypothetical protein [Rhizobium sp. 1399]